MSSLGTLPLILIFAGAAGVIWIAGIRLSSSTDALDSRLGLGSAIGGVVLLAIATNLPELAIAVTAAIHNNLGLAVGNILGGIAIQTLVLAILDVGASRVRPLTYLVGSLVLVIEAALVVVSVTTAIMTTQLPVSANLLGLSPGTLAILVFWLLGVRIIGRSRDTLRWKVEAEGAQPGRSHADRRSEDPKPHKQHSTRVVGLIFGAAALATLVAGVLIELSGDQLAGKAGLSGPVFGATILAAATSLPEVSTGLAAVRDGDTQLAMSDILGGNAFLPVIFVVTDLIAGTPTLPSAQKTDVWIAGLGVVLTCVYAIGIIRRPDRCLWRLGPDSIAAIVIYALGIAGLIVVAS